MRKQLNNRNSISTHLLEKLAIGSSLLGMGITVATQQAIYSVAPLTLALGVNFVNRQKLERHSNKKIEETLELVGKELDGQVENLTSNLLIHLRSNVNYNISQIKANKNSILESESNLITINEEIEKIKKKLKKSISNTAINSLQSEIKEIDNNKYYELLEIKQAISDLENHRLNELNNLEFEITSLKQKFEDVITYSAINQLKSEIRDIKDYTHNNIEKVINTTFKQVKNDNFIEIEKQFLHLKNRIDKLNHQSIIQDIKEEVKDLVFQKVEEIREINNNKDHELLEIKKAISALENRSLNELNILEDETISLKKKFEDVITYSAINKLKSEIRDIKDYTHNNIEKVINTTFKQVKNDNFIEIEKQFLYLKNRIDKLNHQSIIQDIKEEVKDLVFQKVEEIREHTNINQSIEKTIEESINSRLVKINSQLDYLVSEDDIQSLLLRIDKLDEQLEKFEKRSHESLVNYQNDFKLLFDSLRIEVDVLTNRKIFHEYIQKILRDNIQPKQLIIACPWISNWTLNANGKNPSILEHFERLLKHGTDIFIAYGYTDDTEHTGKMYSGLPLLHELQQNIKKESKGSLYLYKVKTHAKYLICDDNHIIIGSHNFLCSQSSQKHEIGIYTTDKNTIKIVKNDFSKLINKYISPVQVDYFEKPVKSKQLNNANRDKKYYDIRNLIDKEIDEFLFTKLKKTSEKAIDDAIRKVEAEKKKNRSYNWEKYFIACLEASQKDFSKIG